MQVSIREIWGACSVERDIKYYFMTALGGSVLKITGLSSGLSRKDTGPWALEQGP